jgi:hypothetical protein
MLTMLGCGGPPTPPSRAHYTPRGSADFLKKWNAWQQLPTPKEKEAWLAEPHISGREYVQLFSVSDCGLDQEQFADWVYGRTAKQRLASPVGIDLDSLRRLRERDAVFDCRSYLMNETLKQALLSARQLTWLRTNQQFAAEDLEWIVGITALRGLDFSEVDAAHADLTRLEQLSSLQWLQVHADSPSRFTVPGLPELEVLFLTGKGFEDRHLPKANHFPKLKCLSVSQTQITDEGVERIAKTCPHLLVLGLSMCHGVNENSIPALARLANLRYLNVTFTPLEAQAGGYDTVPELQIKLPNCHIVCGVR